MLSLSETLSGDPSTSTLFRLAILSEKSNKFSLAISAYSKLIKQYVIKDYRLLSNYSQCLLSRANFLLNSPDNLLMKDEVISEDLSYSLDSNMHPETISDCFLESLISLRQAIEAATLNVSSSTPTTISYCPIEIISTLSSLFIHYQKPYEAFLVSLRGLFLLTQLKKENFSSDLSNHLLYNDKNLINSIKNILSLIINDYKFISTSNTFSKEFSLIFNYLQLDFNDILSTSPSMSSLFLNDLLNYEEYKKIHLCIFSNINVSLRMLNKLDEAVQFSWNYLTGNNSINDQLDSILSLDNDASNHDSSIPLIKSNESNQTYTICCLKIGTKYDSNYVNYLYNMIKYNLSFGSLNFICFTEDPVGLNEDIEVISLDINKNYLTPWWYKLQILEILYNCSNKSDRDWCLYIDLDTISTLDMSNFFPLLINAIQKKLANENSYNTSIIVTLSPKYIKTEKRLEGINSSLLFFSIKNLKYNKILNYLFNNISLKNIFLNNLFKFDYFLEIIFYQSNSSHNSSSHNNYPSILFLHEIEEVKDCLYDYFTFYNEKIKNNSLILSTITSSNSSTSIASDTSSYYDVIKSLSSNKLGWIIYFPLYPKPHHLINISKKNPEFKILEQIWTKTGENWNNS